MNNKLEIYLDELQRDCNKNLKTNKEEKDCKHYTSIEILKVIIKVKDLLDEQK